jgi:hypothetical protein
MEIWKSSFGVIVIILFVVSSEEHGSNGGMRHLVGGPRHFVGGPHHVSAFLTSSVLMSSLMVLAL